MFWTSRRCQARERGDVPGEPLRLRRGEDDGGVDTRSSNSGSRSPNQLRVRMRWASTTAPGATQGASPARRRDADAVVVDAELGGGDRRRRRDGGEGEAKPGPPDLVVHSADREAGPVVAVAARLPVVAPVAPEREADVGARAIETVVERPAAGAGKSGDEQR